jgi:hypothetical protein
VRTAKGRAPEGLGRQGSPVRLNPEGDGSHRGLRSFLWERTWIPSTLALHLFSHVMTNKFAVCWLFYYLDLFKQ